MTKIIDILSGLSILVGFIIALGTAGASDTDSINLQTIIFRLLIALLIVVGYLVLNRRALFKIEKGVIHMSNFKVGMRVLTRDICLGTIQRLYSDIDVAVVKLDDGDYRKYALSQLKEYVEPQEELTENEETTLTEEITLTRQQYRDIANGLYKDEVEKSGSMFVAQAGSLFLSLLEEKLFNLEKFF